MRQATSIKANATSIHAPSRLLRCTPKPSSDRLPPWLRSGLRLTGMTKDASLMNHYFHARYSRVRWTRHAARKYTYMSVIPSAVEGSRPVLGVHARISAQPRQPGEARGSRLRAVDGARSLHFGRDDRICCRPCKAPALIPGG